MRYAQLRAFHHVALCGGFTRAAEQLCLTQPAISDQVRRLEAEYDALLFDRSGNRATLTARGRQLFDHTNLLFEAEAGAREFLTETRAELSGQLRLIADSAYHIAGILGCFQLSHPGVRVIVRSGNTAAVIKSLMDYEVEIGVGGNFPENSGLEMTALSSAPVVAFVAAGHPLAAAGTASLRKLARYPLILREPGSKTRQIVERAARLAGIDPAAALEAEGREAVREMAAAGLGVGFVSEREFAADARLAMVRIPDARFIMEEKLVFLKNRRDAPMIRSFMRATAQWQQQSSGRPPQGRRQPQPE